MTEIKTEIKRNADGSYIITDAHSTADIIRWLLTQDDKDTVLYFLGGAQQRTWVGLTNDERLKLYRQFEDCLESDGWEYEKAIEAELKDKNL